ncbi:YqgE/AlgH family protein [Flavobacterium agricola]|uniref:YqgE/AlgH family protein n=1 Tax=Flavobacterium agricola TaxID=2870839 RepID=A0ABY6LZ63_9FLAO|nr:YqgE/AlgH family protein [Flavobacterium agricola]UYW00445.1 YqgE/AlgH family protein [Flavobacterium agricola]
MVVKKGNVLIAQPQSSCTDIFDKSLIFIADHHTKGSVGFILNKPLECTLNDLLPEIHADFTIYRGGPVEDENLYFIHKVPHLIPNSVKIYKNIYWGGDFSTVQQLLNSNALQDSDIMFFLGYSGWGVNQLMDEIEEEHWLVSQQQEINFTQTYNSWERKIKEHNPEMAFWINAPNNPSYN